MKTTKDLQYGVLWGDNPDPQPLYGIRNVDDAFAHTAVISDDIFKQIGVRVPIKIVVREITYTEGEWYDAT